MKTVDELNQPQGLGLGQGLKHRQRGEDEHDDDDEEEGRREYLDHEKGDRLVEGEGAAHGEPSLTAAADAKKTAPAGAAKPGATPTAGLASPERSTNPSGGWRVDPGGDGHAAPQDSKLKTIIKVAAPQDSKLKTIIKVAAPQDSKLKTIIKVAADGKVSSLRARR